MKKRVLNVLSVITATVGIVACLSSINKVSCTEKTTEKINYVASCEAVMDSVSNEKESVKKETEDQLVLIIKAGYLTEDEIVNLLEDGYFLTRIQEFMDAKVISSERVAIFLSEFQKKNDITKSTSKATTSTTLVTNKPVDVSGLTDEERNQLYQAQFENSTSGPMKAPDYIPYNLQETESAKESMKEYNKTHKHYYGTWK